MEGKGYQQRPKEVNKEFEPMETNISASAKINNESFDDAIKFKNIGFVNYQWTEIVVEDDEECESITIDEVKKAIT